MSKKGGSAKQKKQNEAKGKNGSGVFWMVVALGLFLTFIGFGVFALQKVQKSPSVVTQAPETTNVAQKPKEQNLPENEKVPSFKLQDLNGTWVDLKSFEGKKNILLYAWIYT